MKKIGLVPVVALTLGLASCSVERQVFSDGRTIEWSRKNTVALATDDRSSVPFAYQEVRASARESVQEVDPVLEASTGMVAPMVKNRRAAKVVVNMQENVPVHQGAAEPSRIDEAQHWKAAMTPSPSGGGKSQLVALLLCFFVGAIGIHRFYLGYTWQGIVQLLTAGACGVWTLIDFIRIITGSLQPKNGSYDKTL
jgi:TM2 domain-containing membrane protein YozV